MAGQGDVVEIVHPRPAEMPVGDRKSGRLDDMGGRAQARTQAQNRSCVLGDIGLEEGDVHFESRLFIQGPPRGMSDVNDPDIGVLDEIVDPVWVSRDQAAPQFRGSCVANSQIRPRSNESARIKNRSTHPVCADRVLFRDIVHDFLQIVPRAGRKPERHEPRCLKRTATSSADTASRRLA